MSVAFDLDESLWAELRHPRGRGGKWREAFHGAGPDHPEVAKFAAKVEPPPITRRDVPLERSSAYRMALRRPAFARETGPHGDEMMYELAHERGFAGQPHVVTEAVLKAGIEEGDLELWRGQSDDTYAKGLMAGPAFYGTGFRGNGIYAAAGPRAHSMGIAYAQAPPTRGLVTKTDNPVVMHMALHRHARTIQYADAQTRSVAELSQVKGDPGTSGAGAGSTVKQEVARDPGRWALANGYDAIVVPQDDGGHEVIVLNRTALLVSSELEPAGTNVTREQRVAA